MSINLKEIEEGIAGLLDQESMELVDMHYLQEHGRWVLRFFVDKEGGVTVKNCQDVSKRIGAFLDATEAVPHGYALEVSSPGMNRVIKKAKDFSRFSGERARIRVRLPVNGRRKFNGTLKGMDGDFVLIEQDGEVVRLEFSAIDQARLDPEIRI